MTAAVFDPTELGNGGASGGASPRDHEIRLRRIKKRCLHRLCSNSALCEAETGRMFGRPRRRTSGALFPPPPLSTTAQIWPRSASSWSKSVQRWPKQASGRAAPKRGKGGTQKKEDGNRNDDDDDGPYRGTLPMSTVPLRHGSRRPNRCSRPNICPSVSDVPGPIGADHDRDE